MCVMDSGPEPDRSCQCKGPECVESTLTIIPCSNDIDAEDLLCPFCREHKGIKHCHVFSMKCPDWNTAPTPERNPPSGKEYLEYLDYIIKYVRRKYARFGQ